MSDQQTPEDWRRERALMALARAMRGEDGVTPESLPARKKPASKQPNMEDDDQSLMRSSPQILTPEPAVIQISLTQPEKADFPPSEQSGQKHEAKVPKQPGEPEAVYNLPPDTPKLPATFSTITEKLTTNHKEEARQQENVAEKILFVRPDITASRPLILRITLLGALIGIATALLLWKTYGPIAAFLPLAGLLLGLGAGLAAALFQPKTVVSPKANMSVGAPILHDLAGQAGHPAGHPALGHPPSTDEIRASLRQFRTARHDLARSRAPR